MDNSQDGRPRIPPCQVVTQKFPVMTAGTPRTAHKAFVSQTFRAFSLSNDVAAVCL